MQQKPEICRRSMRRRDRQKHVSSLSASRSPRGSHDSSLTVRSLEVHIEELGALMQMRVATVCAALAVALGVTFVAAGAFAASPVKVQRCGYAHSKDWGRVAVYPWHMSCRSARETLDWVRVPARPDHQLHGRRSGHIRRRRREDRRQVVGLRRPDGPVLLRLSLPAGDRAWPRRRDNVQGSASRGSSSTRRAKTDRFCVSAEGRPSSRRAPTADSVSCPVGMPASLRRRIAACSAGSPAPPLISTYLTPTACSACSPAMISWGGPKRTWASVAPAWSA